MRIGEAARASSTSARSLRFYEDEGLIVPGRCSNGYRDYCPTTIDRVVIIRSLLESGLPLRLIRSALPHLPQTGDATADAMPAELLPALLDYRNRLAARVAGLSAQQAALDAFLARAGRPGGKRS